MNTITGLLQGAVYLTTDYDQFKYVTGNRDIGNRVAKLEKSVAKIGYVPAPIIVNEKMEIIDGQARFEYCKKTGTAIAYYVIPGLTVDDCTAMNTVSTVWSIRDFINSYADRHYDSYLLMEKYLDKFPYQLKLGIWALCHKNMENVNNDIKDGTIVVTEDDYERAEEILRYWQRFDEIKCNRRVDFLTALGYCYFFMPDVDNEILARKILQKPRDFVAISNIMDAMQVIEDAYNFKLQNHVYITTNYRRYLESRGVGWKFEKGLRRNEA